MLRIRQATKKDEERLVAWCASKNNVLYCTKRIGYYDFKINVAITSISDLNNFLLELKRRFSEIIDTYTVLINSELLKLNYIPF